MSDPQNPPAVSASAPDIAKTTIEFSSDMADELTGENSAEISIEETPEFLDESLVSGETPTALEPAQDLSGRQLSPAAEDAQMRMPRLTLAPPPPAILSTDSPSPQVRLEQLLGDGSGPLRKSHRPTAALDEIAQILGSELSACAAEGSDGEEIRELAVRLALLVWDGYGRPDVALPWLQESYGYIDHPIATALRLQAALDSPQASEALLTFLSKQAFSSRTQPEPHEQAGRAEVGEMLLFRGSYANAAELLAEGGQAAARLQVLALALLGQRREAATQLAGADNVGRGDLLWAAHLYDQTNDGQPKTAALLGVLERACLAPQHLHDPDASALLLGIERLRGLRFRAGNRDALLPLFRQKLGLLGGLLALAESQTDLVISPTRALRRIELLATALHLAGLLAEQSSDEADLEASKLYDAVADFVARHKEAAAPLGRCLALAESARLHERRGDRVEAAERFEALGLLLLDAGAFGGASELNQRLAQTVDAATRFDLTAQAAALAYLLRAAELFTPMPSQEHSDAGTKRAAVLYSRLAELGASDEVLALRRLYLLLPMGGEAHTEVVATLAALAETADPAHSLRFAARAARAAEVLHVPVADVLSPRLLHAPEGASAEVWILDIEALARRARRHGDHPHLVHLYSLMGRQLLGSPQRKTDAPVLAGVAAVYQSVAVVLQAGLIESGHQNVEPTSLQALAEAYRHRPGGILIDATRMLIAQRHVQTEPSALAAALSTLLERTRSRETQIQLYRQLGHHAAEHGNNLALAERCFHEVLGRRPLDVMALHALSRILQQRGETGQAVALLQRAVDAALRLPPTAAGGKARPPILSTGLAELDELLAQGHSRRESDREIGTQAAALLCCELGALYEQLAQSKNAPASAIEQAVACYSEALRRDERCRPAARALVVLYRALQRPAEMLSAMEVLLPLLRDDSQRLALLLAMGETATQQSLHEVALRAYSQVLGLQPEHPLAIQHLIGLCRRAGRYRLLVESLGKSPRSLMVLDALREAYEQLGDLPAQARVYEEQLEQLLSASSAPLGLSPQELRDAAVACARTLGLLYQRLEQPDNAARIWERLYDLAPEELRNDVSVLLLLERRYGQAGRHAEQAALLSRALEQLQSMQTLHPDDAELRERRREALQRLGETQRDFLNAPAQATATFEQILQQWPGDRPAMRALLGLYGGQGRVAEQLRMLHALLEVIVEPAERSQLLFALGEAAEKQGNQEEAFTHFGQAFYLDSTNRGAFTAYERLCYRREQWSEAIHIYDTALKLIETQKTRSYRPADLYVRRGQVLLQYLQKNDEALQDYLRAMETDAENDATQVTLERIYAGRNQWRELLAAYEHRAQLVREDIKRVEILRRAARVATAKLRDLAETVRYYEKLHAVDPTDSEALDALEHHYDRSHDFEKLHGLLSTRVALSVDEQQIIALNMRIGLLSEEGLRDHDRAISAYRHVVEQQPTHREALDAMARLFEANERWAELIDVTRKQIRLVTDRQQKALLYFKCGSVTEAKFGKEDDAVSYYQAAVRTAANCLPALHSLRDIYIRREDWVRVTQTLELESKIWTEEKERAGILAHIGQIYLDKLGADARAIEFFEQALSVDKDCLPANRALFQMYFRRGEWERALSTSQVLLQKASREGEPSERSEFHRQRALIALHLGHQRMACDSVSTALEIYPENLRVLELLGTLARRSDTGFDFAPLCRDLEKQFRRRELWHCLARVLCAQAALSEPSADVETAEALLKEAVRLAPEDHLPAEALADLYERLRRFADARIVMESFIAYPGQRREVAEQQARMQLRLAEMCSTGLMDAQQALLALRPLTKPGVEPAIRREAHFRMVQELFILGRHAEARAEMETLIEESTNAQPAVSSEDLARYHDYYGRILEAQGEDATSQRSFRRAVDLDPSFAQPVLALARKAARSGDRAQAELLMRDALEQLSRRTRPTFLSTQTTAERNADRFDEQLRLRRGIARLLATFDPAQAALAYQQIIEMITAYLPPETQHASSRLSWFEDASEPPPWESLDDRVALVDLRMHHLGHLDNLQGELLQVLLRDLRHAPVYALLIELYGKIAQPERAERARAMLSLLGYAGANLPGSGPLGDRRTRPKLFSYRSPLTLELRQRYLLPQAQRMAPYFELLATTMDGLQQLFLSPWPLPLPPEVEPQPASRLWDAAFKMALTDAQRLFGLEVEVLFAPQVPGYMLVLEPRQDGERPTILLDQSVLERPDAERRFLLGRALESLRSRYALLLRLTATESAQWLYLCRALLGLPQPAGTNTAFFTQGDGQSFVEDFVAQLTQPAKDALARLPQVDTANMCSPDEFLSVLPLLADRAGLLFCDDIAAATRMIARLQGEELAVVEGHGGGILLGQVAGGAELARYYLSDNYHAVVSTLRDTSRL